MKFLADENIARSVVTALRNARFDVKDVKEEKLAGVDDKKIIERALKEGRVIITHDKDFGMRSHFEHKGIVLLRLRNQRPENVAKILLHVLTSSLRKKIEWNVVVVSETQVTIHRI